jgi:hypothetical protein
VEGLQFGHGFTALSDHKRPALSHLLQVPAEPGFEFAGTDRRMSGHVVMMTTLTVLVKLRRPKPAEAGTWQIQGGALYSGGVRPLSTGITQVKSR